jgi:hypothetical protein
MSSIAEPTKEVMDALDDDALAAVVDEARTLSYAGKLTMKKFLRLRKRALVATGGHEDFLATFEMFRPL